VIGGEFRQKLVVGDSGRGVEASLGLDRLADPERDIPRQRDALQVLGDVEIGFVEGERLDDRRVFGEDVADLAADCLVNLETRFDEDQIGTLSFRRDRRIAERTPNLRAS